MTFFFMTGILSAQEGPDQASYYHRISWEPLGEEVIQTWEILNESHQVKSLLFKGFYRRVPSE
jgi:hypothetical protein